MRITLFLLRLEGPISYVWGEVRQMFRNPPLPAFISDLHDFRTFTFFTSGSILCGASLVDRSFCVSGSWRSSDLHLAMGRLGEWTILLCFLQPRVVLAAAPKPFCRRRAILG